MRPRSFGAERLARLGLARPRAVLAASVLAGVASAAYLAARPPEVEKDLRRLQAAGSGAARAREAIAAAFGGGEEPILILLEAGGGAAAPGTSLEDGIALEKAVLEEAARLDSPLAELAGRGLIGAWSSPAALIPPAAQQRLALAVLARKDPAALEEAFRASLEAEGFETSQFEEPIRVLREALRGRALVGPELLRRSGLQGELDRMLRSRGGKGYALVAVQPAGPLWRLDEQEELFAALESMMARAGARGDLAGLHALSAKNASALVSRFLRVSGIAALVVVLVVFVLFRDLPGTLLALLPVTLGSLWMAVACDLLGIKLHFMNVGILPLVMGTGVDVGIHAVRQYLDDPRRDVASLFEKIGASVMLASLTTLAAFGSMAFSVNRGLSSVGTIVALGMLGCLLASLLTLPAALELHARRSTETDPPPAGTTSRATGR